MKTYLGLDLGGTKLLIGEIDEQGNILRHKRYPSGYLDQTGAVAVIRAALDDYIATVGWVGKKSPVAMGVGLMGRVDIRNGVWLEIDPGRATPIALAEELSAAYGMPCFLDNDVKSATRAERLWGSGLHCDNFVYLNIGTGIAAGTMVDGRMLRGEHMDAGEVGHTQVGVQVGVPCCCGRKDCVEMIAAGVGLDACARLLHGRYSTLLQIPPAGQAISAQDICALAQEGDKLCSVLVDNAATGIANLIMNLVRLSDPELIVLGGGVISNPYMFDQVQKRLHPGTMRFVKDGVKISGLNPAFVGLLGAAAVAMNK